MVTLSKRFSLCGARIGILSSLNKDVVAGCFKLAQSRLSAGLIDQIMASKLTKVPNYGFTISEAETIRNIPMALRMKEISKN